VVAAVEERLELYRGATHGFAVLVRVGDRTRVLVSGTANVAARRPVRRGDRFHVGSITKSLTAATALTLVDEGRLSLDDTVERWLPGLLEQGGRVTVEQLLSHRSGLPDYWEFIDDAQADLVWKPGAAVRLIARRPLDFPPGTQSVYNNTNFFVLALIVEKVTGEPIEEVMEQRVYAPAGMTRTALPLTYDLAVQGYAGSEEVGLPNSSLGWTAGAAVSTVDDLDRFWQALLGGDLVSDELVAEMTRSHGTIEEWGIDYGLGVMVDPGRCGTMVGHSGRIWGFSAESWTLLGQDRGAIVLTNDDESERGRDIADKALCP
jgi:D-alanyl-D-alanine carboxypeptidase